MKNFDTLFEKELERFQLGGIIVGDRVRFKKDCLKLEYIKNRAASYQDIIKACSHPSFDLNLRVGAVKSIYPTTSQNYTGGVTDAPDGVFLDIYIEYAPGLYRNPMTVPIEAVEVIDDENNRGPIPDSLKRKSKVHGPEEIKAEQPSNDNINLPSKNTVLPQSNKWDDGKPGGGNFIKA
jgi:hypothetical protein